MSLVRIERDRRSASRRSSAANYKLIRASQKNSSNSEKKRTRLTQIDNRR